MILETARELVLQKGFAELSIRKLAEEIGYAPGTIYLYFKNRDEIVREICVRGFAALAVEMKSAADVVEPQERLAALLRAYAGFAVNNPETYGCRLWKTRNSPKRCFAPRHSKRKTARADRRMPRS